MPENTEALNPGADSMRQAYTDLVENIPDDAQQFFSEGMKQMDLVDYPQHVREIMQQYNDLWGEESALH